MQFDINIAIQRLIHFLSVDIWEIRAQNLNRLQALALGLLRRGMLIGQAFFADNCGLRASALTFFSILSIVPVMALSFGISRGFGFEKMLQREFIERFPGHEEASREIIQFADSLLTSARSGVIAVTGIALLFWTVIKVLNHIETSMNAIWRIDHNRPLIRQFTDYLVMMIIGPLLILTSSSANVFISTQVTHITETLPMLGIVSKPIFFSLKFTPYLLIWLLFTLIFMVMPNTRVRLLPAFSAGVLAGTIFQMLQRIYILFQVGVAKYNAIYGSFAALPMFMIWINISWIIVLTGAEFSYVQQNYRKLLNQKRLQRLSWHHRKLLLLLVMRQIAVNFAQAYPPLTVDQIATTLNLPPPLAKTMVDRLVQTGLASAVSPSGYQPACDIGLLTISRVLSKLDKNGLAADIAIDAMPGGPAITRALDRFDRIISQSPDDQLLCRIS